MGNSKTYFEQVPVEIAKKVAAREKATEDLKAANKQKERDERVAEDDSIRPLGHCTRR